MRARRWLPTWPELSWAMYDWGNSGFATTVMAGFFPLFFKKFFCAGADAAVSTARLGWLVSGAALVVALIAPFAGALADQAGIRKRLLALFTVIGTVATALLWLPEQGAWLAAGMLYVLGVIGFSASNIFYDSLLPAVSGLDDRHRVSSLGFALGYLGGALLLSINIAMTMYPQSFGLESTEDAVRSSFITVAVWWAIFSIPLFMGVREEAPVQQRDMSLGETARRALLRLSQTFSDAKLLRAPLLFLAAYWFYMDGVSSVIRMAVDYGLSIGLGAGGLLKALLLVQVVGVPATLIMGGLAQVLGACRMILASILLYVCVVLFASFMQSSFQFYLLAVVIGMVQGGIQALSRSLFSTMIPEGAEAEFFGLYNVVGRFSAVAGPALMGTLAYYSGSARIGILALIPLFVVGGVLLARSGACEGRSA